MSTSVLEVADRGAVRRALRSLIKADRLAFAATLLLNMVAAAAGLLAPIAVAKIVDAIPAGHGVATVDRWGLVLVVAAAGQFVLARFARSVGYRFGERTAARLREQLVNSVLRLDSRTVQHLPSAELASRSSVDVAAVTGALRTAAPEMLFAAIQASIVAVALIWLNPILGLAGLVALAAIAVVVRWYLRRARPAYLAQSAATASAATVFTEATSNARTVALLGLQRRRQAALAERLDGLQVAMHRTLSLRSKLFPTVDVCYAIAQTAVLAVGGALLFNGHTQLGVVVAACLYVRQVAGPLDTLVMWTETLQSAGASLARIEGLASTWAANRPAVTAEHLQDDDTLVLTDVAFAYRPGHDVLHGVNLTLRPGERVAIVGPSGAGKTTAGRLLAGLEVPHRGSATLGGQPISQMAPEALRDNVILVTQEHYVFRTTLRTNLLIAAPEATDDQLRGALDEVGARWSDELSQGLDTDLGEVWLDGGQAQQLALARVLLANPHTVILDEATALLDPRSARDTERALGTVLAGRTVVAIAHRLHTAEDADRIVVMSEGRIVEIDTHQTLLNSGEQYSDLWRAWHH